MNDEIKEYVIKFHNTYEKLAPNYGYETRKDAKELDFNSNNGKLMYATINEIITPLLDYITNLQQENERLKNHIQLIPYTKVVRERDRYKSRLEKAIEVIKNKYPVLCESEGDFKEELINILQNGGDKD